MSAENSETVIREVAPSVWIFSAPFSRLGGLMPMGNRSTAIQLKNGDVWVLASTALDAPTRAKLAELGTVRYIVSGDAEHHMYMADYKKEYPQAKLIGNEAVAQAEAKKDLVFDGVFGKDPAGTRYGFDDEIQHVFFSGHRKGDVAFFHPASQSLMVQDLLMSQPGADEQHEAYANSSSSGHVPFVEKIANPYSAAQKALSSLTGADKEAMRRDSEKVSALDFDRIITCHGNVIETGGKQAWNAAFEQYLQ